jgi:carboxyl-terminal processing protease
MYNTQLKVTISRYYTPSGRCIQALDYAHKDKMEQPLEPMKNYNNFPKGRSVYDGGGVLPDIQRRNETSAIANAKK